MVKKVLKGAAWVCPDYTDSYKILPKKYWMNAIEELDADELSKHVMEGIDTKFASMARGGGFKFIVAGKNFGGGGKSIEHPVYAIKGAGIEAVIAESVSRYFYRNSINNGLPILMCPGITKIVETGDDLEVDLGKGQINNLTKNKSRKTVPLSELALDIVLAGGYIPYIREKRQYL